MSYETPAAFRMALEQRLRTKSSESGISIDRLRRRVIFERFVTRLQRAEPGRWVLKGGMALEVRLRDAARVTKDIDLGLREVPEAGDALRDRLVEATATDRDGDRFSFAVGHVNRLMEDEGGLPIWRVKVEARLAGRKFGVVQVDVSPRSTELAETEFLPLPNSLAFANIATPEIEIIDVQRHAAEKYHAMTSSYGDRENSRSRDLLDLVIMHEHELLRVDRLAVLIGAVWKERGDGIPPSNLPELPTSWRRSYEENARELHLDTLSYDDAVGIAAKTWRRANQRT